MKGLNYLGVKVGRLWFGLGDQACEGANGLTV